MKTKLATKQSQHLIELGVPKEKASGINTDNFDSMILLAAEAIGNGNGDKTIRSLSSPIFKLEDFLNGKILPKEIETENGNVYLNIQMTNEICSVSYKHIGHGGWIAYYEAKELINALYLLTYWYYGEYLKM